jgi:hypothetical protein
MIQFTVETERTLDGYNACIPSIRECDSWAATEDDAITNMLERLAFFTQRKAGFKHTLDVLKREDGKVYYTLIIKERK